MSDDGWRDCAEQMQRQRDAALLRAKRLEAALREAVALADVATLYASGPVVERHSLRDDLRRLRWVLSDAGSGVGKP